MKPRTAVAYRQLGGTIRPAPLQMSWTTRTLNVAVRLTKEISLNIDKLTKQRRGYLAASFPDWTANQFESALEKSDAQSVTNGLGIEITAIHDDRFLGEMLKVLLERLTGKVFDIVSLARACSRCIGNDLLNR